MATRAELPEAPLEFRPKLRAAPWAWVERETFPLAIGALYTIVLLIVVPGMLVQDSWATLVTGHGIATNGLPHHETLTVMARGVRWVDQQWLAQLTFYELFRAGGLRLVLLTHVALIASAFAVALVAARRRGGSPLAVFGVACLCFFVAPWGWQLRAQSFAPLLFVLVLALLVSDGRSPSRRVFLTLPLLALWANLHGSVVLGALLVALYGITTVAGGTGRETTKGTLLTLLAPVCVLCSPYGLSLIGYYRELLVQPPFGRIVDEWTAPTPEARTALFYVLVLVAVWALGKRGGRLTLFEQAALLVTMASALHATRNIVWFGLAALILLPVLFTRYVERGRSGAHPAARVGLNAALLGTLAVLLVVVGTKPTSWYRGLWPDQPAVAAVAAATHDRSTRVFASDRNADWLLWRLPQLRGRVAFDIRFELNTAVQIKRLQHFFARIGPNWQSAARGYEVVVLDRKTHENVRRSLLGNSRLRQIYLDHDVAVLVRSRS
jgi:hypothetical protein